jgi:transposase-like protein
MSDALGIDQGSKQIVANEEIQQQILNIGIRKLERAMGVSHQTINRILKRGHVRRKTLAKIVRRIRY